jgi:hypothetical protein
VAAFTRAAIYADQVIELRRGRAATLREEKIDQAYQSAAGPLAAR